MHVCVERHLFAFAFGNAERHRHVFGQSHTYRGVETVHLRTAAPIRKGEAMIKRSTRNRDRALLLR
jgi:hypothetical protein